jgi:hypothetical protein
MLFRQCAEGHDISIWAGGYPLALLKKRTSKKKYIVVADDEILIETDSFDKAENMFIKQCENAHRSSQGKYKLGVHKMKNHKLERLQK